jgi:sec-independent protein translocase protein TatA
MGVGGGQLLIIAIILVVLFVAPSRLPGLGKSLAQAIRGFKKGMTDDETDVTESVQREKLDESDAESMSSKASKKEEV